MAEKNCIHLWVTVCLIGYLHCLKTIVNRASNCNCNKLSFKYCLLVHKPWLYVVSTLVEYGLKTKTRIIANIKGRKGHDYKEEKRERVR